MNYLEHYPYDYRLTRFYPKEKFYHMTISTEKQCGFLKCRENFLIFASNNIRGMVRDTKKAMEED